MQIQHFAFSHQHVHAGPLAPLLRRPLAVQAAQRHARSMCFFRDQLAVAIDLEPCRIHEDIVHMPAEAVALHGCPAQRGMIGGSDFQ